MLHYELILPSNDNVLVSYGVVALPDNVRGADMYLFWKKRGYQLRRVAVSTEAN